MAKKKKNQIHHATAGRDNDKPATLKDALSPDILQKLKTQTEELKANELVKKEEARKLAEEKRKQEQKKLENDFDYLLNNSSMDWRKFK
jgi:hypothetical protein